MTTLSSGSEPSELTPEIIFDQPPNHAISPLINDPLPLPPSSIPLTSERSPFDDEQGIIILDNPPQPQPPLPSNLASLDLPRPPRTDKGKGRAREVDPESAFTPSSTSTSSSASSSTTSGIPSRRNDSTLEGDISILAAGSREKRDMFLHPQTAEVGRSSSPSSSSGSRRHHHHHRGDPNESNQTHQHHQRRTSQKSKQTHHDPRWDLDTMPDKSPLTSNPTNKEEYSEPIWTGSKRVGNDVGGYEIRELGGLGDAGFLGEVGDVDYPMANVEQEEEKRIQDVSATWSSPGSCFGTFEIEYNISPRYRRTSHPLQQKKQPDAEPPDLPKHSSPDPPVDSLTIPLNPHPHPLPCLSPHHPPTRVHRHRDPQVGVDWLVGLRGGLGV